jgi:hypothetical protein
VTLWRNDTDANNWLRVKLNGRPPNTDASGARIYVTVGGVEQMREVILGSNFLSQNPTMQIFGLGSASSVDELRVEWPDGEVTDYVADYGPPNAGQTLVIDQPPL